MLLMRPSSPPPPSLDKHLEVVPLHNLTKEKQVEELQRRNLALVEIVQTWVKELDNGVYKVAGQSVTVFLQDTQPDTEQHRPASLMRSRDAHACYFHFVVIRAANESLSV